MYAIVRVSECDKDEVLAFDGTTVRGKQLVVEMARKSKYTRNSKDDTRDNDNDDTNDRSKPTCTFYLEGRCNKPKGQCRFAHPKRCSFHAKGKHCKFGDDCKFAHIEEKKPPKKQEDGSVALLTTFLQALGMPQFNQNRSSRNR